MLATAGTLFSASLVAYSFARFEYRPRSALLITLATMMMPAQVTLIPQFVLFFKLGWFNTLKPLWIPAWFGGGAFGIFLMRQFFIHCPWTWTKRAYRRSQLLSHILGIVPLSKPIIATLAIITIIGTGHFLGPLI